MRFDVLSGSEAGVQHHAEVLRPRPGLEPLAGQQPNRKLCQKLVTEDDAVAFVFSGLGWGIRMRLPVLGANLDARKCSDHIWHGGFFHRLMPNLSLNWWFLVVHWNRHLSAGITFRNAISEEFPVLIGTRHCAQFFWHSFRCQDTSNLEGFVLLQVLRCAADFRVVLELAVGGAVDSDRVRAPREDNGLVDSIRLVIQGSCEASPRLLRLLTCWHSA